ncbi:VHS domain protein [Gregarina niphandrodes]|uniref:VHS domain protein n=1 Tax=Gregarina niphandrodes TaxID=110365 RepID=A0A023B6M4_GRENI|nr:VHS domain protein [Gregarina niphandrodes]EZG66649.1 VHS domain protein [Gregarina niphandrodes]|eukprot:XP_011130543.1 VHS domain protein [Gregarina niphandrodes]
MQPPAEAPDAFDDAWSTGGGYDVPAQSSASRSWEQSAARDSGRSAEAVVAKPVIQYAAPGNSNSGMNPASTVAFMLNMGYPPPPIALEPLRRLVEQVTMGHGSQLNLHNALYITDEISRSPYRIAPAVLFVLQQRLHSSKPDRVSLALELLDMCVKNCGLEFIRHINKEFMKSMSSVIKTTSFKERTFTGQMKRLEKYITGAPTTSGVATDPRVHKLRRMCLVMIQNWCDAFEMYPNQVGPILDAYQSLKRKGINFPPKDPSQRYMIKDGDRTAPAAASAAGTVEATTTWDEEGFGSKPRMEAFGNDPLDDQLPLTEKQFAQIESMINILRMEVPTSEKVEVTLARCESLRTQLESAYRELNSRVHNSSSRKLRCSNPAVTQLNALMSLDTEYRKLKGVRLLFDANNTPATTATTSVSPLSRLAPAASSLPVVSPPPPKKPVNLLDDLLDEEERQQTPAPMAPPATLMDPASVPVGVAAPVPAMSKAPTGVRKSGSLESAGPEDEPDDFNTEGDFGGWGKATSKESFLF